jgi:hypothetical protein
MLAVFIWAGLVVAFIVVLMKSELTKPDPNGPWWKQPYVTQSGMWSRGVTTNLMGRFGWAIYIGGVVLIGWLVALVFSGR